uniref:Muscular LMNA interacting protein n=1 Tax=Pipistrellus kuhlii TaxID=59472 RepID=A0A7J7YMH8_PIPKU|nr:muscular LMNA interacting protein [Pipistrellus kuhlii]
MEFEKHEKGSMLNENSEEKLTSNFSEYLTLKAGSQQQRDGGALTYPSEGIGKISKVREFKVNEPQGMQQSGLFKAEYVFIVDSEGEDEATSKKVEQSPPGGTGTIAPRPTSLAISSPVSDVVRPKTRAANLQAPSHPEMPHGMASQQKHGQALDEPAKTETVSKDNTLDPPLEHSSGSPSSSLQKLLGSDTTKTPTTLPRSAGRETKYANLSSPSSTVSESQLTKPGVIRPVPVKSKILLKEEEEVYEPNPFSKYLEDNNDLFSEQ